MGIDYSTILFWGSELNWFSDSFVDEYSELVSYLQRNYGHPIVEASQWAAGFQKGYWDLEEYIYSGGCGYESGGLEYCIGIKICELSWFGSASVDFSIEQLQQYQKEYEEIREHFEMLFGVEIPLQGKLGVCVHRH